MPTALRISSPDRVQKSGNDSLAKLIGFNSAMVRTLISIRYLDVKRGNLVDKLDRRMQTLIVYLDSL